MTSFERLQRKLKAANRWLAAGIILSGLGAFGSFWFGNEVSDKKENSSNNRISELNGQNDLLRQQLDKSREETKAYTMGTDTKVFFVRISYVDEPLLVDLNAYNGSELPCYNLQGYYANLDEPNGMVNIHFFSLPELPAHSTSIQPIRFKMHKLAKLRINIFMTFRNGSANQQIRVKRIGNKTWLASRVQFNQRDSTFVQPGFPGYDPKRPDEIFN